MPIGIITNEVTETVGSALGQTMSEVVRKAAWSEVYMRTLLWGLGGAAVGGLAGYGLAKKRKGRGVAIGATVGGIGVAAIRLFIGWRQVEAVTEAAAYLQTAPQTELPMA